MVLGDLAEVATAARPLENSTGVSVVSMPGGVSAQTGGDGERSAASAFAAPLVAWPDQAVSDAPAAARALRPPGKSAKRAESPLTFAS